MAAYDLAWRPTARRRRLLTVAAVALVAAFVAGRPALMLLAVPLLVLATTTGTAPDSLEVTATLDADRCFEDDSVELTVLVRCDPPVDQLAVAVTCPGTMAVEPAGAQLRTRTGEESLRWRIRPERWGRHALGPLRITVVGAGRGVGAEARHAVGELVVFPRPVSATVALLPATLPHRSGDHAARTPGHGVEFVGTRPYAFGDSLRRVNWPVTSRRGELYVNDAAEERSVDLVVLIDTMTEVGAAPHTSLDRAVRGAAGLAQGYLDRHDRVGLVALGGVLRWLRPDAGERQWYRIIEAVLDVRRDESYVHPDLARVPRPALPPAAVTVLFSPLLDDRAVEFARDLRERGLPLVVVDVLCAEPAVDRTDVGELSLRLWRLDRQVLVDSLTSVGAVVVDGGGADSLEAVLAPLRRTVLPGRPR